MNAGSILNSASVKSLRDGFAPIVNAMRGGSAAVAQATGVGSGPSVPVGKQLIETLVYTVIFSITMQLVESSFGALKKYQQMAIDLFPATYDSPQTYPQDPSSGYELILPSRDERNGTEYSYACFISVQQDTFTGEANTFKHVFSKGSKGIYPLMSPGVFFMADKNTLRVYQNTQMKWNNYVDVENFPIKKWVHLVVMVKGKALDVYINGNLANRRTFVDLPKLNYGGFYMFLPKIVNVKTIEGTCSDIEAANKANQAAIAAKTAEIGNTVNNVLSGDLASNILSGNAYSQLKSAAKSAVSTAQNAASGSIKGLTTVDSTQTEMDLSSLPITINGRMNGFISRMKYFAFALTYSQIDKLIREGPNPKRSGPNNDPLSTTPTISIGYGYSTTNFTGPAYVPNPNSIDNNLPGYQSDSWWTSTDFMGSGQGSFSGPGPEPGNHYGYGPQ